MRTIWTSASATVVVIAVLYANDKLRAQPPYPMPHYQPNYFNNPTQAYQFNRFYYYPYYYPYYDSYYYAPTYSYYPAPNAVYLDSPSGDAQPYQPYPQQSRPAAPKAQYYCPDTGYYPSVQTCPKGWLRVVPDAPPPQ